GSPKRGNCRIVFVRNRIIIHYSYAMSTDKSRRKPREGVARFFMPRILDRDTRSSTTITSRRSAVIAPEDPARNQLATDPLSLATYDAFILRSRKESCELSSTEAQSIDPDDDEPQSGSDSE